MANDCIVCESEDGWCEFCPRVRPNGTTRTYRGYAADVDVIGEEFGFELHVTDENGDLHVFNVQRVAEPFYRKVRETIGPWLDEGEAARGMPGPVTREDLDAYEPGDPKRIMLAWEVD